MAKIKMKKASGRVRKLQVIDQNLPGTIEVKLYRLNAKLVVPFLRNSRFGFRVPFDVVEKDGSVTRRHVSKCPVIQITVDQVVQTENETAQRAIEMFIVPQNTLRNGSKHAGGNIFEDVTKTETGFDVDLDEIFEKA